MKENSLQEYYDSLDDDEKRAVQYLMSDLVEDDFGLEYDFRTLACWQLAVEAMREKKAIQAHKKHPA